jgi:aryl-alcohol dehydrogenase-like predicted oxidoreductase
MRYRKLGTTDLSVSVICLGTMTFGEQNTQQDGFDQMDYALERGVNFFDTAELYAVMPRKETYGKTEEILGNWFQEKKNRDKIILASKIASKSDGLEWIREGSDKLGFDKKNMNAAIDASLKRLKTDYIDLYQLHWPERQVPKFGQLDFKYDPTDNTWTTIEEVLFNLNELVKDGKVRHVGLSNETPWGMMKFLEVAKQKSLPRMMSIQNVYSLVNRVFDIGHSEVSTKENCGLLAYSPLAGGRLSGKYIGGTNT